jgi:predicted DNA-binding protein
MTTASEPEVVVSARIERDDRQRLKRLAAQEDRTVSTLVRRAVREYLADRPDDKEVNR